MNGIVQGTRVEIISNENEIVISRVAELSGENIIIESPKYYSKEVGLNTETEYQFVFFVDKSLLWCDGTVTALTSGSNSEYLLKPTTHIEAVRRRQHDRFRLILPFTFYNDDNELVNGVVKDISQGGMRFVSNENITQTTTKFVLDIDSRVISISGNILAQLKFPKSNYQYQYRVKFNDMKASEIEAIKAFIFNSKLKKISEPVSESAT